MRNKMITLLFLLFIFSMGFLHLLIEDKTFSEHENRVLASFPQFTVQRVLSGKFMKEFEEYVSDQFVAKNIWSGIKAQTEQMIGKNENNGIYFGNNGYLFEPYQRTDEQMNKNVTYINDFADQLPNLNHYILLVPTAIDIYSDYLPRYAPSDPQKKVLNFIRSSLHDSVKFIDVYDSLATRKHEYIFFKTDHHWTMRGAYYAYLKAGRQMNYSPLKQEKLETQIISNDFYGTHHSKANSFKTKPDQIEYFTAKSNPELEIIYNQENKSNKLFAWDALNQKDQYRFFLNGNHRLVNIKTNQNNGKKVGIIKDSYAHTYIPFMINHYEEIHVIDLRYFHNSVTEYIYQHNITDVLFLYNVASFSNDKSLIWLNR